MNVVYKSVLTAIKEQVAAAQVARKEIARIELDPKEWHDLSEELRASAVWHREGDVLYVYGVEIRRQQWPFPKPKPTQKQVNEIAKVAREPELEQGCSCPLCRPRV